MKTIHAIYENGVFRPTEPVDLPEGSTVQFVPLLAEGVETPTDDAEPPTHVMEARQRVYEILSRRYNSGHHDTAERHNEHQP